MQIQPQSGWRGYLAAIGCVSLGAAARMALTSSVGDTAMPFIFFFPAVTAVAWYGGFGPGMFATLLAVVAADVLFVAPVGTLAMPAMADSVATIAFVFAAGFIVAAVDAMHRARERVAREGDERRLAEQALADARDLLSTTLTSIGDGVIVTDAAGRITFVNAEAARLTGWTPDEAAGQPLLSVFPIENETTRLPVENPVDLVLRQGTKVGLANHTVLVSRGGSVIPIDDSAAPIRRGSGPVLGVVLVFRDVTADRASDRARAWLATIVEHSTDAIVTKNLDGIVQSWNASAERLLGYTGEEIIGTSITRIIPVDRLHEETRIISHLRAGEPIERFETIRVAKGGREIPVSLNVSPIKNRDGEVIGASKVLHDISDVLQARQARNAVESALREADRRKDEFLAILSHELRNPLAPIRMAVTMLRQVGPPNAELQQLRDIIDRQTHQLMRLLDDLLDVSRIGSGKIRLRKDVISLAVAVSGAVETVRPLIDAQGQELVVRMPAVPIELEGDLGRLAQVFANLLNNASKFTDRGGRIEVIVERQADDAVVMIRDNGIGIDAEHMAHVFELFQQVDQSLEKGQGGLGVGLSLARSFVEMHGGRIEARSDGLGRGSAFVVSLPIRDAAVHASRTSAAEPSTLKTGQPSRRILVADDNVDSSFVLATALRAAGHDVQTTHDGLTAVELVESFHPELAILDIGMPRLNGYDAARQIRAQADALRPTLVAITGWGQEEDRRRAFDAGFDRHLTKPVDLRVIQQLIDDLPAPSI
jgi:PAS domain S-box-containing protein